MKKIGLVGFYGKNNAGDNLLACEIQKILKLNGKNIVTVYSDIDSENVIDASVNFQHLENDIIVIGGGGIISESFWFFNEKILEYLIQSQKLVLMLNVNLTYYNLNEKFANNFKKLNSLWYVRDKESVKILSSYGINSHFLPDVSFSGNVLTKKIFPENLNKKVLSVFLNGHALTDNFQNEYADSYIQSQHIMRTIAKYLDWMASFDWEINILPSHLKCSTDDRISGGIIYSFIKNKEKTFWETDSLSYQDITRKIENSNLVLSMRFHPTALCVAANIDFLDLTHHDKNKNFLIDVGLEDCSLDYNGISVQTLINKTIFVENNLEHIIKKENYCKEGNILWRDFRCVLEKISNES